VAALSAQAAAGRAPRVSPGGSSGGQVGVVSVSGVAAVPVTLVSHPVRYVVHAGDSLAGIAAAFDVAGGWPVLYAANRRAVGGDPDVIGAGLVLVVPGVVVPARYTVAAGDSLAGIAAAFGVAGGWRALYAVNRHRIGADPDVISAGLVLAIPRPAAASAAPGRTRPQHPVRPAPGASARPAPAAHPVPAVTSPGSRPRAAGGMPGWLKTTLLAAGLLIAAAFVTEPVLAARRRRQQAPAPASAGQPVMSGPPGDTPGTQPGTPQPGTFGPTSQPGTQPGTPQPGTQPGTPPPGSPLLPGPVRAGRGPGPARLARAGSRRAAARTGPIVLADHDRLVVTRCQSDDTVYVLRPPGADPQAILRVASLVLPERRYGELAEQLGVPASWPME
jgi:LysM repeat protein